jgi:hypothetical protein
MEEKKKKNFWIAKISKLKLNCSTIWIMIP